MAAKHRIRRLEDFRPLVGKLLFESAPVAVTEQGIQDFCRSTLNEEWIHWDRERCRASHFGGIIAPGLFLPALFPGLFWKHMRIDLPRMIVKGIDGIRIFRPLRAGAEVFAQATLTQLLERDAGLEVHYLVRFFEPGIEAAIGEATFKNRYWEDLSKPIP